MSLGLQGLKGLVVKSLGTLGFTTCWRLGRKNLIKKSVHHRCFSIKRYHLMEWYNPACQEAKRSFQILSGSIARVASLSCRWVVWPRFPNLCGIICFFQIVWVSWEANSTNVGIETFLLECGKVPILKSHLTESWGRHTWQNFHGPTGCLKHSWYASLASHGGVCFTGWNHMQARV